MTSQALHPVVVDGVHKSFEIPREQVSTLKERVLHPLRGGGSDTLAALRGVSFAVQPGEFFGIVGRNGSGKSTLLKCLAGIYRVDRGNIYVNGPMSTFIELGVGFNPDLPARDNAMLNATMLGLSPREARRRFDSVIDFAELGDFVDLKIKNYSSGMLVRLAFAVMIHVDAEILLIDEVLAVGDAAFQQKCFDEFERIRRSGATVLFVTHDMGATQRFCDRALLLEHGRPVELGDPEHVGNRYLELNFSEQARQQEEAAARAESLPTGRPCSFAAQVRFHERIENPLFGINIQNSRRDHVLSASNLWSKPHSGNFEPGEGATLRIHFENVLAPDRYHVTPAVARQGGAWVDRRERMISVVVTGAQHTDAMLALPYELVIERESALPSDKELIR